MLTVKMGLQFYTQSEFLSLKTNFTFNKVGKSDLNGEVTSLPGLTSDYFYYRKSFGIE